MESYIDKQDVIHKNAKSFNEDCERLESALEAFENDEHNDTIVTRHATTIQLQIDPLSRLYAKVACTHMMTFQDYCSRMQSLNRKQCEIVMYNRAWCKSYTDGMQHGQKLHGYRVFLSGSGGTGKSHVLQLIQ